MLISTRRSQATSMVEYSASSTIASTVLVSVQAYAIAAAPMECPHTAIFWALHLPFAQRTAVSTSRRSSQPKLL